jgi:hypothetical protein
VNHGTARVDVGEAGKIVEGVLLIMETALVWYANLLDLGGQDDCSSAAALDRDFG